MLHLADAAGVKGGMCWLPGSAGCALGLCVPSNSLGTCELCGWGHISGHGFAVTTIIQVLRSTTAWTGTTGAHRTPMLETSGLLLDLML